MVIIFADVDLGVDAQLPQPIFICHLSFKSYFFSQPHLANLCVLNDCRAYNLELGAEKEQLMMTGLHRIRSVKCKKCKMTVGWTYVS
jgi:hypothetical protein